MAKIKGETELRKLITNLEPILNDGEYVFVSVKNIDSIPRDSTVCEFKEEEGITVVLSKEDANKFDLEYEFIASWITLNVHSALEAVGLTAAFATELANHNINCNVIAGYFHDHIFVDRKDGDKAMHVLKKMTKRAS